jgi:hypothetical protein
VAQRYALSLPMSIGTPNLLANVHRSAYYFGQIPEVRNDVQEPHLADGIRLDTSRCRPIAEAARHLNRGKAMQRLHEQQIF